MRRSREELRRFLMDELGMTPSEAASVVIENEPYKSDVKIKAFGATTPESFDPYAPTSGAIGARQRESVATSVYDTEHDEHPYLSKEELAASERKRLEDLASIERALREADAE